MRPGLAVWVVRWIVIEVGLKEGVGRFFLAIGFLLLAVGRADA